MTVSASLLGPGDGYLGGVLTSAAHAKGLRDFFSDANGDEKAREAMDLSHERGGFLSLKENVCTPKELLDYRGRGRCDTSDGGSGGGDGASASGSRPSAALAECLALPALYRGMAGVASAMLGSLEEHFGASPGSISGLMDVWEEDESGAAGAVPPGAAVPAVPPPPAGSPPPASVLSCIHNPSTQCDVQHVDRGLLTVMWSSAPGLQVYHPHGVPPGAVSVRSDLRHNGHYVPSDSQWSVADAALGRGEVVVFAGEALTAALGGCLPFRAPVHRVWPRYDVGRLAVAFKARVNLNHEVFHPPPCRGVAQAPLAALDWQRRVMLTGSVNRPMPPMPPGSKFTGSLMPVALDQPPRFRGPVLPPHPSSSTAPARPADTTYTHLLEESVPCDLPARAWSLVLQQVGPGTFKFIHNCSWVPGRKSGAYLGTRDRLSDTQSIIHSALFPGSDVGPRAHGPAGRAWQISTRHVVKRCQPSFIDSHGIT